MKYTRWRSLALLTSLVLCLATPGTLFAQGIITTVAGSTWIFRGDGGPATNTPLGFVYRVAADSAGNLYIADAGNNLVEKVSNTTGVLTIVAGNGISGYSGDGGPATSASLSYPEGVAVDTSGNVYIADTYNGVIRKVSLNGIITTVAGIGIWGYFGDGGLATQARLNGPTGVAVDTAGNLYIADVGNNRVRKVSNGIISTVAGDGYKDSEGFGRFTGDGGPATQASLSLYNNFLSQTSISVDAAGNLYIADITNECIRKVDTKGIITTIAGNGSYGFSGDGGLATKASLAYPSSAVVDSAGNLYIADSNNARIRRVNSSGTITTFAGTGAGAFFGDSGQAASAALYEPLGVALDPSGNLYIADALNLRIRRVTASGIISTAAGNGLFRFSGDGGPAYLASLNFPSNVVIDASGNLYITDLDGNRVRKVNASGIITTFAGNGAAGYTGDGGSALNASMARPASLALDSFGNLFISDSSNNVIRKVDANGIITTVAGTGTRTFSVVGDGGPATKAGLGETDGIAVDAAGNLYVADYLNHVVRKVDRTGTITTIAGKGTGGFSGDGGPATNALLNYPKRLAVDGSGNLYITDSGNFRIRKITPAGIISTFAGNGVAGYSGDGGPATSASLNLVAFSFASGLAADASGNLYIADTGNGLIRKVSASATITTVAGNGLYGYSGDGGLATQAPLDYPVGVAADKAGNLYIADAGSDQRIRKVLIATLSFTVSPASLSFSGTAGTAGTATQQIAVNGSIPGLIWSAGVSTSSGGSWLSVSPTSGQTPQTVSVSVDATNLLSAGTYQGAIDITVPAAVPSRVTVAVTFTVSGSQPASLSVQPANLSFQPSAGSSTALSQSLQIQNAGAGTLTWSAKASTLTGGNWLAIGSLSGTAPSTLTVSAIPAGLSPGRYAGVVAVTSGTQTVTVPVTLTIAAPAGVLLVSQTSMFFRAVESGGVEPPQTFAVLNVGSGTIDWALQSTVTWAKLSVTSGSSQAGSTRYPTVQVSVDPSGLPAGLYPGLVKVTSQTANNAPQVLKLDLLVLPKGTPLGAVVRPTGLIFTGVASGSNPGSQTIQVSATDPPSVQFLANTLAADWVKLSPERNAWATATTSSAGKIVVQPDLTNLQAGVSRGGLTVFTQNDGAQYGISLLFVVLPAGSTPARSFHVDGSMDETAVGCAPTKLQLQFASLYSTASSNSGTAGFGTVILVNAADDCGNPATGGSLQAFFSNGDPYVDLTDLGNGQYTGTWRPKTVAALTQLTVRGAWKGLTGQGTTAVGVNQNPVPSTVTLFQKGVTVAAGYAVGPIAPGGIISLFGQNLSDKAYSDTFPATQVGTTVTTRVLIGDTAVPLFYVGPGQINAQVPANLDVNRQLQIRVEANGQPSAPEPLQTVTSSPGIFTLDPVFGAQRGAVLISNTKTLALPTIAGVDSRPAHVGEYVTIYCTGLGATTPVVAVGQLAPGNPPATVNSAVTVQIGTQTLTPSFAGLTPGFAGLYQVDVQIPSGTSPNDQVPVVIQQNGISSNTVMIAVQ